MFFHFKFVQKKNMQNENKSIISLIEKYIHPKLQLNALKAQSGIEHSKTNPPSALRKDFTPNLLDSNPFVHLAACYTPSTPYLICRPIPTVSLFSAHIVSLRVTISLYMCL